MRFKHLVHTIHPLISASFGQKLLSSQRRWILHIWYTKSFCRHLEKLQVLRHFSTPLLNTGKRSLAILGQCFYIDKLVFTIWHKRSARVYQSSSVFTRVGKIWPKLANVRFPRAIARYYALITHKVCRIILFLQTTDIWHTYSPKVT